MKVTDRIRAFLNDRPVRSDATGMFIERDDLRKLLEEIKDKDAALTKIASYEEGAEVTGSFDEPVAAKIAREAIEKHKTS